jgi:peptidoglycan/LPS O-acetylase OafA/YrhL
MDEVVAGSVNDELNHPRPGDLLRLTSLRAFAALIVFFFHIWHDHLVNMVGPFIVGDAGVSFFFILSGFVLAWSTVPTIATTEFYRRRFARIYPSTFVVLLVSVIVPAVAVSRGPKEFVTSLFLVQAWDPAAKITYGMNGVAWSLSCEMAFYVAFPFAMRYLVRSAPRRRWFLALGYVAIVVVAGVVAARLGHPAALASWPPARFGEFLLGMVAALEIRRGWRLKARWGLVLIAVGSAFAALDAEGSYYVDFLIAVFFAVIVLAAQRDLSGAKGVLSSKALVYAGQVSFCFYLVHELIIVNLRHKVGTGWGIAVLALALAMVAAVALHHLVELPFQRILRGHRAPRSIRAPEQLPRA